MKSLILTIAMALACTGLNSQTTIRVGAVTAIPGLFDLIKEPLEKERGIKLVYTENSGPAMLADVEDGKLDVAVAGITMEGWLETMKAFGRPVRPVYEYKHLQIGVDQLSVLINPDVVTDVDVLMMDLNKEQIKGLFTGKFKNWKELGGPDLPVVVMISKIFKTTAKVFQDAALEGRPFAEGYTLIDGGIYDIATALVKTKGAISIGPLGLTKNSKIWSPGQAPKIERPFIMVVSDHLNPKMKKAVASMVEFILGPGQKYLSK